MLELRPNCECCDRELAVTDSALICSFECTWCPDCAQACLAQRCPNCSGDLQPRPVRPEGALANNPASTKRIYQPGLHKE